MGDDIDVVVDVLEPDGGGEASLSDQDESVDGDRPTGRSWKSRLALFGVGLLLFGAALDAVLLYTIDLDAPRFATDTVGLTSTRFQGSFESNKVNCRWCNPDGWVIQSRTTEPDDMVIGEDFPTRDGSHSLRVRAEKDWEWNSKPRVELSSHDQPFFKKGVEYWVGWSIFLPDDGSYEFDSQQAEVLMQVHGENDSCDAGGMGPPAALRPIDGRWRYDFRWDPTRCMSDTALGREVIDIGPQERGRWTDFVVRWVFSHEDDGVTQLWRDGELVVDRVGHANHYNSELGPYIKLGIYKSGWLEEPSDVTLRMVYLDAIRVYEGSDGFAEVDPANPIDYDQTWRRLLPVIALAGLVPAFVVLFKRTRREQPVVGDHNTQGD